MRLGDRAFSQLVQLITKLSLAHIAHCLAMVRFCVDLHASSTYDEQLQQALEKLRRFVSHEAWLPDLRSFCDTAQAWRSRTRLRLRSVNVKRLAALGQPMAAEFRQLPDLDIPDYNEALPLGPSDLKHGVLPNGMRYAKMAMQSLAHQACLTRLNCTYRYYVKKCAKPQKRAALALAVNVGSAVERDDEQGVAHIVEHLAFNATEVCRSTTPACCISLEKRGHETLCF